MNGKSVLIEDKDHVEKGILADKKYSSREHFPKAYPRCLDLEHGHGERRYRKIY
jgi:hypothetical protein